MKKVSLPSVNKFDWVRALSIQPRTDITRTEHHVALALASYLAAGGTGFATHTKLANDCRISERTVCAALTSLVKKGWLLRHSGKQGRATDYWTRIPPNATTPDTTPAKAHTAADVTAYLKVVATCCGLDTITEVPGSDALERLTGTLAHILSVTAARPGDAHRLFAYLTEGPLDTARDPAAVLLHRLGQLVRTDKNLIVPTPPAGAAADAVTAAVQHIAEALTSAARN